MKNGHTHYSLAMHRGALLFALLFTVSCKKHPPAGDSPPANPPAAPTATAPQGAGATPSVTTTTRTEPSHGAGDPASDGTRTLAVETKIAKVPDKLPDGRLVVGPFSLVAPATWTASPPTSGMRAAEFTLPAKPGAEAALVVFYFGAKGAGSVEDNLDRWLGQFQQPDGKDSRSVAKIEKTQFAGQDATYVSVTGRFVAGAMPGGGGPIDKPDQEMLAAIVASPSGPYYFKLVGAKATVDANTKAFRDMLESLKVQ